MSLARRCSAVVSLAILACLVGTTPSPASPPAAYGQLPLTFEVNQGQTDPSVEFVARSTGYQLFLTRAEAVLVLRRPGTAKSDALRMSLLGANLERPHGVDQLPGTVNYLVGSDPAKWRTSIPTYARVLARGVYPGVDLVYYGNQRQLEYDFIVAPGADPASIRLAFHGLAATAAQPGLALDESGDLNLHVSGGDVRLRRPVAYQRGADGDREPVSVAFAIVAGPVAAGAWHVGFQVGAYDRSRPLVIDPVISYSTYLGGTARDAGMAIAVRGGEAYVTGYTDSPTFPPAGGQPVPPDRDAFVAKLNADGSGLVYATYLGGNGEDAGMGIAVDSAGRAHVTGYTDSTDFPTAGVAGPLFGNQGGRDAFVTKLNAAGTGIEYSTYLGGELDDTGLGITVDALGHAYVTGWTDSTLFPTSTPYQTDQTERDAFVTRLNAAGSALVYSTYLGGAGIDEGHAIAADGAGNAYVTGWTRSSAFPTTANGRQKTLSGTQDAFVTKLNSNASGSASLIYSTYFGGSGVDAGYGIAVDATSLVSVTGSTTSTAPSFIIKFGYQAIHGGGQDAFIAKFDPAQAGANATLLHSSFLGGAGDESGLGIAVDEEGQAFIVGFTTSANFPTFREVHPSLSGTRDAFVAKFDPAEIGALSLRYSTYLGGSDEDEGYGVALDAAGSAYVVGLTRSTNFPVVGSATTLGGPEDAFVAKLGEPDLVTSALIVPATAGGGGVITIEDTTKNTGVGPAGASTTEFYLSTDSKLSADDLFLGSRSVPPLPAGQDDKVSTQLTLPSPLAPATYFLFAKVDAADAVGESFEGNNKAKKAIVVGPDLSVSVLSVTSSGSTIKVTNTAKNVGGSAVAMSTTTQFFLAPPTGQVPLGASPLGSRTVGPLDPGAEDQATTDLTLPATATGNYTIVARVDATGVLAETSETNNEKSTPFAVGVDLVVSSLVNVPGTSGAGLPISNVTATILNQGANPSAPSTTAFFLSATTSIDATAVSIGTQAVPALQPNATSAVPTSLTIPAATTPGAYFIIAKANGGTSPIAETSVNNNTRARSSVVGPDLTIAFLFPASATVAPGKTLSFKDTTKNLGGGKAATSVTKFYLSSDATWDPGDAELGQRIVPALDPGVQDANLAVGVVLTIPATTAGGSYFIIVRANAGAPPIGETNATNNTATAAVEVRGADLVVSALTAALGAGSTLSITDTTKNQGTSPAGASVTQFFLSADSILDEATDTLLGTRDVGVLAPGAASEATTTFPLPPGAPPVTFTIFAKADATGTVPEGDEGNNKRSRTLDSRGSDLIISNLSYVWGIGATLNVTDTTRNEGPAIAGASTTRFYLSTNATWDTADTPLGSGRSVVSLAAGNQSMGLTAVTIPAVTPPGDYFLIARANADTSPISETNDANNTAAQAIAIRPDLTVSALSVVPSAATPGATVTVSGTVRNEGRVPAGASALKLFLSTDATVGAGDKLLVTRAIAALATDKGEDFTVAVVLPDGPGGSLFVIAQTDADDQVPESNETNNTRVKSMGVGGDLVIFTLSGPPRAGVGSTITVDDTTRNQVSATVGATTTRFYFSTDAVFDPSDVPIGSRLVPAIGARKTHAGKTPVTIPPTTPAGAYFIIGVADADGVESEANEENNTKSFSIVIGSDLVVSAVGVPATAGSSNTITVTDTTTNQGGAEAGASMTRFYLSTDATYGPTDAQLGSRPILPLAAGAPSNGSTDLVIPPSTQAGIYYIIVRADADGVVNEADEGNNTKASVAIAFGPDLVLSSLSVPVTTGAGAIIKVSVDVTNVGGAQAGESVLKFFLSTDLVVGPGDALLGSRTVPMLGPGARDSGATNVTIPVDTSTGVFFLIAQVDANGQVTEVNEANNILTASLKTGPDLQVEALTVPAKGAPGTVITITDSTKNLAQLAGSSVTRFYLSADDRLDANDIVLGNRTIPALAFGARSLLDSTVALPTGISGTWYIIAQADATNVLVEADEDNNTRSRAIAIGADFIVSGVTAPAGSGAGLSIAVGATIKNQGAATGSSVTHFYLSSDDTLSGGDPFLGSLTMPAMAAGDAKVGSTTVTLPANLPAGNYYVIAKANGDGAAPETDATNNTKARLIILGPDLMVSDLTVQAGGGAGLLFTITDTTRNAGAGAAPATTTSYYLSIDGTLDASDVLVGSRSVPALAPLVSNVGSVTLTIPPGTLAGNYLVIAVANTNGVSEIDPANNTRSRQTKIGPDLSISTLVSPASATAGSTITVTATTANPGAGNAGPFTVRVYLSTNELFDPGVDFEVGSSVVNGVAAGASSAPTPISVRIPPGISGPFTLIVWADADNAVSELSDTNNQKPRSLNVLP